MTADQTARNPGRSVIATAVVAEVVLGNVAMQMLWRNLMMNADDRPFKKPEEAFGGIDVSGHAVVLASILASRMIDPITPAYLAAEPVVNRQLVSYQGAVAVEPAEHQRIKRHRAGRRNNRRASFAHRVRSRRRSSACQCRDHGEGGRGVSAGCVPCRRRRFRRPR